MADMVPEPPLEMQPPQCIKHAVAGVDTFDAAGNPWCEQCNARCRLMTTGFYRQFPPMRGKTFFIGEGAAGWRGFAIGATDALIEKIAAHLGSATTAPARAA